MRKTSKKTYIKCEQHEFSLKPKGQYVVHAQHVNFNFCVNAHSKSQKRNLKERGSLCIDCPVFNNDMNYATPTFILTSQKIYYGGQGQKLKNQHQKKMTEYTDQKSEILVPRPRSKNSFCSVCRQNYDDYLEHIDSLTHTKKIHQSTFNKDILQMSNKYSKTKIRSNSQAIMKNVGERRVEVTKLQESDDDQVVLIQNPNKKIKINQNIKNKDYNNLNTTYPTQIRMPGACSREVLVLPTFQMNYKSTPQTYQDQLNQLTFNYNMSFFMPLFAMNGYNQYPSFLNYNYGGLNSLMRPYDININISRPQLFFNQQVLPVPSACKQHQFIVIDD